MRLVVVGIIIIIGVAVIIRSGTFEAEPVPGEKGEDREREATSRRHEQHEENRRRKKDDARNNAVEAGAADT